MNYITLIFDLKDSKSLENRNLVQEQLISSIKECNSLFSHLIKSNFLITLGDEWQGLLKPDSNPYEIINFFKKSLSPKVDFYTAIGIGEVTVTNFELTVNQLDGPSFHLARQALKYAKKKKLSIVLLKA
ncbi:MAG: SatD family protein [Clostridium sp.]